MKKEKYLKSLKEFLETKKFKNKDKVIEKYESIINERVNDGENIKEIIKSFKSFEKIYREEKRMSFMSIFKKVKIKIPKIEFKRFKYFRFVLYLLITMFSLTFIFNLSLFFSSLFLILDGANTYGISLFLFSLSALNLMCLLIINKKINNSEVKYERYICVAYVIFGLLALSIALSLFQLYKIDTVEDVSEKYEMKTIENDITLPSDISKKYYIHLNSWYDNKYIIHYDNEMSNKIKIKLEYYECFYNSIVKKKSNSIYLSLVKDKSDLISFYIDNLRDNKIYSAKELSRNIINIYVSEEDYKRIIFID